MIDPLTLPSPAPLTLLSSTKVPNVFPKTDFANLPPTYRLAIVGEAPGEREEQELTPFVGPAGSFLNSLLSSSGVDRDACFIGNLCKHRPPGNEITEWLKTSKTDEHPNITAGWLELQTELAAFAPHCILALGNTPLSFLTGKHGILNWRGSILSSQWGKVVPAVHPAFVLREYKQWPLLRFDIRRAREEAETPSLSLPQRLLELDLSAYEICRRLDSWPAGLLLSFDIEGGLDAFPCCSVADQSHRGFIIAWTSHNEMDQGRIAQSLSRVLYRCDVPKCLQNSLYDRFVLAYGYRMLIRGVTEDTMDKQWAIYPELKKSLGTICSIWTREPYYKFERTNHSNQDDFYRYCIKDSCVTLEAALAMDAALSDQERRHYNFNIGLKSAILYMQLRGFRFDTLARESELLKINGLVEKSITEIEAQILPMQFTKKELTNRIRGEGGSIGDQRLKKVLYEQKGYPPQKKGRGKDASITCDAVALLNLAEGRRKSTGQADLFIQAILLHKKLESTKETLKWQTDPADGRMKCSYNQFSKGADNTDEGGGATETGRLRCSKSIIPTSLFKKGKAIQVGGNLQTVTKKLRRLYVADPGNHLFQCDLAGADGWTVAAHCLKHGDPTMWDDYKFGLKPAKIIALMFARPEAAKLSREELKEACKAVDQDGWLYFGCKRIQHATNYGVQGKTAASQILKDSYNVSGKPVFVDVPVCEALQRLYLSRYPGIYQWHQWAKREVSEGRNLQSASGHTRIFFGRRKSWDARARCFDADHETWKEFLADEPQENTTYATNLALHRLWHDRENRISSQSQPGIGNTNTHSLHPNTLIVAPLHQVHDALIGQFPKEHTAWAIGKLREWFNNPLRIANTLVTIPFEGAYGPSWGELGEKYGGGTI